MTEPILIGLQKKIRIRFAELQDSIDQFKRAVGCPVEVGVVDEDGEFIATDLSDMRLDRIDITMPFSE